MNKKIVVSLLSVSLMVALITATVNPSSVMAIVGLSSLDAKTIDKVQADTAGNLNIGLSDLAQKMGKSMKMKISSEDGAVIIDVTKSSKDVFASIYADTNILPADLNVSDIGKVIKYAQTYLEPIFNEKQAMGLYGILFGEACAQYKRGIVKINISKEYEGITITASGDVKTGLLKVDLKSTLGVKKCQPNRSKTMEMKVLPL